MAWWLLLACGAGAPETHRATASLDGPEPDTGYSERTTYDLAGEVTALGPSDDAGEDALHPSWSAVSEGVEITTDEGAVYRVSWAYGDADGTDWTEPVALELGESVQLHFASVRSFGNASGFVLSDDEGVVVAVEDGSWGPAMYEASYPVSVVSGASVGRVPEDCGMGLVETLVFDGTLELAPGDTGLLDGTALTAWSLANFSWVRVQCTDTAGAVRWALTR